jgi:hypothetical protein
MDVYEYGSCFEYYFAACDVKVFKDTLSVWYGKVKISRLLI